MLRLADSSKKSAVKAMAVVSSCGRTSRGRISPLSAHLQNAGKGRSLTLEHAHRTAAAMA